MLNTKEKRNLKLIHNTVDSVNGTQKEKQTRKNAQYKKKQFFSCAVFLYGSFVIDEPNTKAKIQHITLTSEINRRKCDNSNGGNIRRKTLKKMTDLIWTWCATKTNSFKMIEMKWEEEKKIGEREDPKRLQPILYICECDRPSHRQMWVKSGENGSVPFECVINLIDYLDWGYLF